MPLRCIHKRNENMVFHSSIFIIAKKKKRKNSNLHSLSERENVLYPYNGILFDHKKWVLTHAMICVDLENTMSNENSQLLKSTYYRAPFLWNAQNSTSVVRESVLVLAWGWREWWGKRRNRWPIIGTKGDKNIIKWIVMIVARRHVLTENCWLVHFT